MQHSYSGIWPALITPFHEDSSVDWQSYKRVIQHVLAGGVSGVVVAGSTGEASTLTLAEYEQAIRVAKEVTAGNVPVFVGINASSTELACERAQIIQSAKADGILLVSPPYNKPPQRGIVAHFEAVKKTAPLPIMLYNIPGRTGVDITPDSVLSMFQGGIVQAVKESTGSVERTIELVVRSEGKLPLLSGEDGLILPLLSIGALGAVSVGANVVPEKYVAITQAWQKGDVAAATKAQLALYPLVKRLFMETNPIPLNAAMNARGLIESSALRLPLTKALPETFASMKEVLS